MLPYGMLYPEKRIQFVHVDDVARLIAHILRKTDPESQRLTILNLAGRGEPLTYDTASRWHGRSFYVFRETRLPVQSCSFLWKLRFRPSRRKRRLT